MTKNLVVVESPAKAKTIEGFLGKDYKVVSSFGHIRDLPKKNLGIILFLVIDILIFGQPSSSAVIGNL